jgi:nucleoside-diphosphate-sugar epimerase
LKALVTGAAGFIAGYLVEELLGHGYEVVGLDNLSSMESWRRVTTRIPGTARSATQTWGSLTSRLPTGTIPPGRR